LVSTLIAAAAVLTARETRKVPLAEIDGREEAVPRRTAGSRELSGAGVP
jgi:hypothetical protein